MSEQDEPYTMTPEDFAYLEREAAKQKAVLDTKTPEEMIAIGLDKSADSFLRMRALERPELSKEAVAAAWEQIACDKSERRISRFAAFMGDKLPLRRAFDLATSIILDASDDPLLRMKLLKAMPEYLREALSKLILNNDAEDAGLRQTIAQSLGY